MAYTVINFGGITSNDFISPRPTKVLFTHKKVKEYNLALGRLSCSVILGYSDYIPAILLQQRTYREWKTVHLHHIVIENSVLSAIVISEDGSKEKGIRHGFCA